MRFLPLLLSITTLAVTACQSTNFLSVGGRNTGQTAAGVSANVLVRGKVMLPQGFAVKATSADILNNAMVALLDAGGTVRLTGTTDATGAFTLYRPTTAYAPADGALCRLEILKRVTLDSGDQSVLSLATWMQRNGSGWNAFAKDGDRIVVTAATTAMTALLGLLGLDPLQLAAGLRSQGHLTGELWGLVTGPTFDNYPFEGWNDVGGFKHLVESLLLSGKDPVGTHDFSYPSELTLTSDDDVRKYLWVQSTDHNLTVESPTLTTYGPTALSTVHADLTFQNSPELRTILFDSLNECQSLIIDNCPHLNSIQWGPLQQCPSITIRNCPELTQLSLMAQLQAPVAITVTGCGIADLGHLSGLPSGSSLTFKDNPNLPVCRIDAIRDQLQPNGITVTDDGGNNTVATCP